MDLSTLKRRVWCRYLFDYRARGLNFIKDLKVEFGGYHPKIIFDIGANIGQSALRFTKAFPDSEIYSFEIFKETFEELKSNVRKYKNISCYNLGLSSYDGFVNLLAEGSSDRFHVVNDGYKNTIKSKVMSLDNLCEEWGIKNIDFLKSVTVGHDYDILQGAENLLNSMAINIIHVECSMCRLNTDHISLGKFEEFLESKEYYLYNIYDQKPNWPTGELFLRRSNAVFMSRKFLQSHVIDTPWNNNKGRLLIN